MISSIVIFLMFAIGTYSLHSTRFLSFRFGMQTKYVDLSASSVSSTYLDENEISDSKLGEKFTSMVRRFNSYSEEDVEFLENDRLRNLVLGGKEALKEPKVLTAFYILYEDILPVRFGGDILFNILDKSISEARNRRMSFEKFSVVQAIAYANSSSKYSFPEQIVEEDFKSPISPLKKKIISTILGISKRDFFDEDQCQCVATFLFPQLDTNKDGNISKQEFQAWIENVIVTDQEMKMSLYKFEVEDIYNDIDADSDGRLTIEEFQLWTKGALENDFECEVDTELELPEMDERTKKFFDKYRSMVETFKSAEGKWSLNQSGYDSASRREKIAFGCFAGAKNEGVVKALEILYIDYLPLRVAGDIIFKLMKKVML